MPYTPYLMYDVQRSTTNLYVMTVNYRATCVDQELQRQRIHATTTNKPTGDERAQNSTTRKEDYQEREEATVVAAAVVVRRVIGRLEFELACCICALSKRTRTFCG